MKKRFLSTLLALCMVLSLFPEIAWATDTVDSGTCGENLVWNLDSDGTFTINGTGDMLEYNHYVDIPWYYSPVNHPIKTIIVSDGVTSIGRISFGNCTNLSTVIIPNSVTIVKERAFEYCSSLANILIPQSVTTMGKNVFLGCDSLTSAGPIGGGYNYEFGWTDKIPAYAFNQCSQLASIALPDGITSIGYEAFAWCRNLDSIIIPDGVSNIGSGAFWSCTSLTDVNIPNGVTSIEDRLFANCSNLTSISFSKNVKTIGDQAFALCTSLKDIYYSGSQTDWQNIQISSYDNSALDNATIHYNSTGPDDPGDTGTQTADGVLRSGDGWKILWKCTWKDVNGTPTNGRVDITMEGSANRTDDLYIYNENSNQGFPWELAPYNIPKSAIKTLSISGDLVGKRLRIAANSFQGYSGLETVVLDDVTGIDSYAFEGCTALKSVGVLSAMDSISIGKGAFKNCTSLTDMDMPSNLEHIGDEAFQNTALGTITLGRSVTEIGADAFTGCRNVKIRCYEDSVAHRYAQDNQIPFEIIQQPHTIQVPLRIAGKNVEMEIEWNPSAFFADNAGLFNQDLAVAGLALSDAAESGESAISNVMTTMGFPSTYQVHFGYRENNISQPALSIAAQEAIINGQEKTLIALVVRGTDLNSSDPMTDVKSLFDGFEGAGNYVRSKLDEFIETFYPDLRNGNTILFVTGHSLGGACAGLLARSCILDGLTSAGNVFAYTFASPRNAENTSFTSYVHNVVNREDVVPVVPPNFHGRVGINHNYTTKNNTKFIAAYKTLSGEDPSLKTPLDQHLAGTYMALLLAGETMTSTSQFGYRLVQILCPVDVEVYDSEGKLSGRVINNVVDTSLSDDNVLIMVSNDEKYIYLLDNEAYSIRLTGTAEGTLKYFVQDFNVVDELVSEKAFTNVKLEASKKLQSEVGEVETPEVKLYVVDSNGAPEKEVLPDGNGTEVPITTPTITYTITLDGYQTMTTNADGKLSSLPTPTRSGYTFVGWYMADGTRVTVDTVFRSNVTIYARWSENSSSPSSGSSSSGGSDNDYTPSYSIIVPNRITGGTVKVSPTSASENQRVTVTVKPNAGYQLETLTVADSKNNELTLTPKDENQYTFRMPKGKVSVNAVFRLIETPWSNPFQDVTSGAWYYEAVKFVSKNSIMSGYGDGTFAPDNNLSRAMLAQILYNNEGKPSVTSNGVFSDVLAGAWYANAVNWAAEHGIVTGYGNGAFGPDDNITREQLAVMLWRYAGGPVANEERLDFTDAEEVSNYALNALHWAVENKIINGKTDGTLAPKGLATRAQAAQMLKNFLDR